MARPRCLSMFLLFLVLCGGCSRAEQAAGKSDPPSEAKPPSEDFVAAEYSAAKRPGTGVKVDGRLTRSSVRVGQNTIPTWKVEVTVANYTEETVRLGESMTVLEKIPEIEDLAGIYVARESKQATGHLEMMPLRYGLFWGVTVATDGPGIWPFGQLPSVSALSGADLFMLVLSSPWVKPYYPDGGYPAVGAGRQAVLREEILVPLKSGPQSAVLLTPLVLEAGKAPVQAALRFDFGGGLLNGKALVPTERKLYRFDDAVTRRLPGDVTQPAWLRLHALNWLAESTFDESAEALLRFASDQGAPEAMRSAALLNLGLHQHKPAIPVMLGLLKGTTGEGERAVAVAALGEAGDPSVAGELRPLLNDASATLALGAIEALGKLKDAASVPAMLGALADRSREPQYRALAGALARIGGPEAWNGLLAVVGDRKAGFQMRVSSALALGEARHAPAVPVLAKVLADEADDMGIRLNMISALEAVDAREAWTAIRGACGARNDSVARSALQAMARSKSAADQAYVVEIAGQAGHPLREEAISQIKLRKMTGASATLRAALRDPATPENLLPEALSALVTVGEKPQPDDWAAVWSAFQRETDPYAGQRLADALIESHFGDKTVIPSLVAELDEDKNKLWFANVKLLRHLTGQKFGPEHDFSGDTKTRKADLDKWREWLAQQPKG